MPAKKSSVCFVFYLRWPFSYSMKKGSPFIELRLPSLFSSSSSERLIESMGTVHGEDTIMGNQS